VEIAILATVGIDEVPVSSLPKVGVIATGSELVEPSQKPGPVQIRNSNSYQLCAQIEKEGCISHYFGIAEDSPEVINQMLQEAITQCDVILLSGGVSVGDFDFVPSILRQNNVQLLFEKVAVKPGKPTIFGVSEKAFCFGLPGNPVSTFVTFELLVKPFLYKLMGHDYSPMRVEMCSDETVTRKDTERQSWVPVKLTSDMAFRPVQYHGSAHILALCQADGLISMDVGVARMEKGTRVSVRLL